MAGGTFDERLVEKDTSRIARDTLNSWVGSCSKRLSSKAAAKLKSEAYSAYVELLSEARTKLTGVFNSFLFVVLVVCV